MFGDLRVLWFYARPKCLPHIWTILQVCVKLTIFHDIPNLQLLRNSPKNATFQSFVRNEYLCGIIEGGSAKRSKNGFELTPECWN